MHDESVTSPLRKLSVALAALALTACPTQPATEDPPDAWTAALEDTFVPTDLVTHDVRIIVEPSDNAAMLIAAIDGATQSVHMTMYLLTSPDVIDALVRAHGRGLDVRVVLNRDFPTGGTTNDDAFNMLAAAGIGVHWAPSRYALTHEKCVVIDGREAWIMTMNTTVSSPTTNREYLAVDREPVDVADANAIFEADYAGTDFPTYAGPLLLAPVNAEARLYGLISHATTSIDVECEVVSDRNIVNALVGAAGRGVTIRVLVDGGSTNPTQTTALTSLMASGVAVRELSTPDIHAKAIVVDGTLAYVGSINLTQPSIDLNRELGLITDDPDAVHTIATTIDQDFARGRAP